MDPHILDSSMKLWFESYGYEYYSSLKPMTTLCCHFIQHTPFICPCQWRMLFGTHF